MLFMAPSSAGQVFAIKEKYRWVDGQRELVENGFIVRFRRDREVEPHVYEQARATFNWSGMGLHRDGMTPLDPIRDLGHIGFFDSAEAPEEIRTRVEQILLNSADYGRGYVLVDSPNFTPPWPNYDEIVVSDTRSIEQVAEQISGMTEAQGHNPIDVHLYERNTLGRPEVLEALLALANPQSEEIEVTA